ncbi:ATP-binding protein [Nannocystis radixulma]|uniref:ATP-binding protein n=1 Tax=Nannocystis radixulma TaxID=2995305 RepID=A0ABT5B8I4_9BACT|nr:ATP-binding protein [Nannocystis radixulma]MDC0670427.1 ATP-binding protein [Nannocystis radixulma]
MNWVANPYRPGAGHMPLHVAGREPEQAEFRRLLDQEVILSNVVLTGPCGVGKTVLLERFRELAVDAGWRWVGTACPRPRACRRSASLRGSSPTWRSPPVDSSCRAARP